MAEDLGRSTGWENSLQTNIILADIFDLLMAIYYAIVGKKQRIKPYPRPGAGNDKKRIGKGAMPYDQLRKWIKERQGHG